MLQEADMGLTNMAMGGANARYEGDETLLVKFFMNPHMNPEKSQEEGRPIFEEVPFIQIVGPGNKESIIIRKATEMDIQRFAEHYRRFKDRESQEALDGTPLSEWPGCTRSQAEELKFFNVRTVEQLVGMTDANAQKLMGVQMLKQRAKLWLEDSKDNATVEALNAANERIEQLEEMMRQMMANQGDLLNQKPLDEGGEIPPALGADALGATLDAAGASTDAGHITEEDEQHQQEQEQEQTSTARRRPARKSPSRRKRSASK